MKHEPLSRLRVLDMTVGPLGAIGRILGELGADVVRIEPPGGASDRHQGPTVAGISLAFAAANLGKRGVALSLQEVEDRGQLGYKGQRLYRVEWQFADWEPDRFEMPEESLSLTAAPHAS